MAVGKSAREERECFAGVHVPVDFDLVDVPAVDEVLAQVLLRHAERGRHGARALGAGAHAGRRRRRRSRRAAAEQSDVHCAVLGAAGLECLPQALLEAGLCGRHDTTVNAHTVNI